MLKKTITYTDFNDEEVSEDFFFHLSQAEIVELEVSHEEGFTVALQRIVDAEDHASLVKEFQQIILKSYGQRSVDGKRFVKNEAVREEFKSTAAYSALFMELVTNTDSASEFINGILPKGMAEEAARITALQAAPDPEPEPEKIVAHMPEKPLNPSNGDLWADKETGKIYQYVADAQEWKLLESGKPILTQ